MTPTIVSPKAFLLWAASAARFGPGLCPFGSQYGPSLFGLEVSDFKCLVPVVPVVHGIWKVLKKTTVRQTVQLLRNFLSSEGARGPGGPLGPESQK